MILLFLLSIVFYCFYKHNFLEGKLTVPIDFCLVDTFADHQRYLSRKWRFKNRQQSISLYHRQLFPGISRSTALRNEKSSLWAWHPSHAMSITHYWFCLQFISLRDYDHKFLIKNLPVRPEKSRLLQRTEINSM